MVYISWYMGIPDIYVLVYISRYMYLYRVICDTGIYTYIYLVPDTSIYTYRYMYVYIFSTEYQYDTYINLVPVHVNRFIQVQRGSFFVFLPRSFIFRGAR